MKLPYESATAGRASALDEIEKTLEVMNCSSFGHMTNKDTHEVLIQFSHCGREYQFCINWDGYAEAWLRAHPYGPRQRCSLDEYREKAQRQAQIAVYSILRDLIKAQVTMAQCGLLSMEKAFIGHLRLPGGMTLVEMPDGKLQPLLGHERSTP